MQRSTNSSRDEVAYKESPTSTRKQQRREFVNEELQKRKQILTEKQRNDAIKREKSTVERLHASGISKQSSVENSHAVATTGEGLTDEQMQSLTSTFSKLDVDRDGRISRKDLRKACRKLGILLTKEELGALMMEGDPKGQGFIGYSVYEHLLGQQLVIANYKNKQIMTAFRQFDKNGDGYITKAEVKQVFTENGVDLDDKELTELIEEADTNADGVISFEEFVHSVFEKDW